MFGKREPAKFDPAEFRLHDRKVVHGLKVYVDRELVEVLDYSDGGVRIRTDSPMRRTVVIEVFRKDKKVRETVAVQAWQRGDQVGFAFRPKLKLTEVPEATRERRETIDVVRNATGGVAGSALRSRLKL